MPRSVAAPLELADVLEEIRTDATALRRHGMSSTAETLEDLAARVSKAAADLLTWWPIEDAATVAGWSLGRMRRHVRQFEHTGHVRVDGRRVLVRAAIVPRAVPDSLLRAAGRRAA